ncbi:amidase [Mesorhizobium sp.]|uniref:amidase n=1 Tax=Mesorhizobium sp. TaxID=1871066 RepID=UPI00257E769E|nr:amidase [Mesorhizobium sp.]
MTQTFETSAVAALAAVRSGNVSASELTSHFLARIDHGNSGIHALRHVMADEAVEAAGAIDARIQAGEALALAGLPFVVKENCDTVGAPCSAGLSFRLGYRPTTDSWITAKLRAAGAIILGVAVSDPGAFDVRTLDVTHPLDPSLTVGGSSGGSAAALAAGFCLGAIGTDTGGSIRIPSACCGTVGLKPSYGALPMDGVFPLVTSLDHVGPMARSVEDVELIWQALVGREPAPASPPRRVGYDPAWVDIADKLTRDGFALGLRNLKEQGIDVVRIALPELNAVAETHSRIFLVEAAAYHLAHHGGEIDTYPDVARNWFATARDMPVGVYVDACAKRLALARHVDACLAEVDAIVAPTLCVSRPPRDGASVTIAGAKHDFTRGLVRLTSLFDHTGHPAIACPIADGSSVLPPSMQVVGRHGEEAAILRIAKLIEQAR